MITIEQKTEILARHSAILGMSGSGKTFDAKGLVEFLLEQNRHTVIIDPLGAWPGMRTNAAGDGPGFQIPIFGGEFGDIEIDVFDGASIAELVLADNISCIMDLSHLRTGADQRMFMEGFVGQLRGKARAPLNLVVDECDEFAPETAPDKVGYRLIEDMKWIAKRGRQSGFILTAITQRPADISKAVLTQMQTLIVHQLIAPQDQKPVDDWLKGNGDAETRKVVAGSLAKLKVGERWIYSPRLDVLDRDFAPLIKTFDSSRAPEPGEALVVPKMLAQIDVTSIRGALMKSRPAEDAPATAGGADQSEALSLAHDRISDLETEAADLRQWKEGAIVTCKDTVVRVQSAIDDMMEALGAPFDIDGELRALPRAGIVSGAQIRMTDSPAWDHFDRSSVLPAPLTAAEIEKVRVPEGRTIAEGGGFENVDRTHVSRRARPGIDIPRTRDEEPLPTTVPSDVMNPTALAFAEMLDRINPARVTWAQLCSMTGRKPSGGNFNTARKQLRASGRMVEEGDKLRSSAPSPRGMTRVQAIALWKSVLSPRAQQMIAVLDGATNPMTKQEIADAIGIAPTGGNWNGNFAQLRNNDLLEQWPNGYSLASKLPGER